MEISLTQEDVGKLLTVMESLSIGLGESEDQQTNCFVFGGDRVLTYNEEITCSCKNPLDGFTGAVPAAPLLKVLRKIGLQPFKITMDDEGLLIELESGGSSRIFVQQEVTLSVDEFEEPPEWTRIPEKFADAVLVTSSCVSRDNKRVIFRCVHIHPDWIECCNNDQVCRYMLSTGMDEPVLIYATSLKKALAQKPTKFCKTDNWLHFRSKVGVMISCRRVMGTYHNLNKLIESRGVKTLLPKGLETLVDYCSIFTSEDRESCIRVRLKGSWIGIKGQGPSGWYQHRIKTETPYEGEPVTFEISPELMRSIMSRSRECEVCPGKLVVVNDDFIYLTCTMASE